MTKLFACLALAFAAPIFGLLYAQEGPPPEQYEPPPPVGMDVDYFPPPKQKMLIGFRILTGPTVSFSGSGIIPSGVNPAAGTYNDGTVSPDTRTDLNSGLSLQSTANADGRTNTWSFDSAAQIDAANQGVDMHTYSATIDGNNPRSGRAPAGMGYELTFERDFGWHIGKIQFDLIGGLGMNKINYSRTEEVAGMMTSTTAVYQTYNAVLDSNSDPYYDTNGNQFYGGVPTGVTLPPTGSSTAAAGSLPPPVGAGSVAPIATAPTESAPYAAPSSTTDASSNSEDNSTLIGSTPISTSPPSAPQPTEITEQWNITGAYFTLRAGAQMTVPITDKFSASVSGGPALVYVGTTFLVNQTLTPPTGNPITSTVSNDYNTVLPAYFANADLNYSLTDTTGLYLGAVFQSATSYNQAISSPDGNYTTKVNFGNQEGVRAGISFKF